MNPRIDPQALVSSARVHRKQFDSIRFELGDRVGRHFHYRVRQTHLEALASTRLTRRAVQMKADGGASWVVCGLEEAGGDDQRLVLWCAFCCIEKCHAAEPAIAQLSGGEPATAATTT